MLFLSDLDGTLMDSNGNVTDEDVECIHQWTQKHAFGFVTGRDRAFCVALASKYQLSCEYMITDNGANAYYKDKQYAKAILNYERALLLSPGNEDARFNLNMANSHITDKIEPVGSFFLTVWIHSLINTLSSNSWAILGIISFLLFIVGIYLYFFTRNVLLRKIGFFAGLLLLLVSIFSNSFASEQKDKITERNEAIVFAPTITIKSSPAESGTDLFVLHEGTKVKLLDKVGDWSEILLADGNRGWIPTNQIEII